jgi:fumarylacetoacetate (FAA) hydrolase
VILVTHLYDGHEQLAIYHNSLLYNMDKLHPEMPNTMSMFLNYWDDTIEPALKLNQAIKDGKVSEAKAISLEQAELLSPVPFPTSCRYGSTFLQAATGQNSCNFYFTNHNAVQGPGEITVMPDHLEQLDFEFGFAIVINREGRNIPADIADNYIGGLMIMNNMVARQLHPDTASGKDFCTALGPWLVTIDELEPFEIPAKEGHTGIAWNLSMKCRLNEVEINTGSTGDMHWTFAELIERCSYGVTLHAGDVIGSGPVAGQKRNSETQWLQPDDIIEMEIERLSTLTGTIVADDSTWSLEKS